MNKDLKDYLHLYLGCQVETPLGIAQMIGIEHDAVFTWDVKRGRKVWSYKEVKPILRKLEYMTQEEENHVHDKLWEYASTYMCYSPEQFHYLLKQGFDLFNLIDSGLAVERETAGQQTVGCERRLPYCTNKDVKLCQMKSQSHPRTVFEGEKVQLCAECRKSLNGGFKLVKPQQ